MRSFIAAALAAYAAADASDHWAVIMAGSNTYGNYRHQADTNHAVKIMLANGIPRDHIIHLSYDDVASSSYNPYPGQLFNKPITGSVSQAELDAANVYDASYTDYKGYDVTAQNFYNVLLGDDSNGPALKSNENSHVFLNFADHGGVGLLGVPYYCGDYIYADELNNVLKQMHDKKMFKQLTFYVEACESGSMFPDLTDQEDIYAITATNASSSSWGTYCGSDAYVGDKYIGSCLGDLFSVNWMEDSDANDLSVETLAEQAATVKRETTKSPVQQFGDLSWQNEPVGDFQGVCEAEASSLQVLMAKAANMLNFSSDAPQKEQFEMVDSRDHDLHMHYNRVIREGTEEAHKDLEKEIAHRQFMDKIFNTHFADDEMANAPELPQDWECYRKSVRSFEKSCGRFTSYSMKFAGHLAKHCDAQPDKVEKTLEKVAKMCEHM